ncbi:MAG: hypothetical protein BMS9Abin37_1632 [Acidobacteriota bacterium]|nr:MAG: hypothetical protein BMS9Abin37_1632 [Acidobacteriota bacterium]
MSKVTKVTVERGGKKEQDIALSDKTLTIGRESGNDVVLLDPSVSRRHARIEPSAEGYRIVDLGSGNGILKDGERVPRLDIKPGTVVTLGEYTLRFELDTPSTGAAQTQAKLILIGGGESVAYAVSDGETLVGRSSGAAVRVSEPLVSSSHCKIVKRGSVFALVDLGSENGTYVNGVRVKEKELEQGTQIRVGPLTFYFAADGVEPKPGSIELIQPVQSPQARLVQPAPAAADGTAPDIPPPAAGEPAQAKRGLAALPRVALIGGGLFLFVLLLIALILLRSPEDKAEREFQDVFQANLSAEERERIEEYQSRAADYEERGNLGLALEQYRKILVLDQTHQQALAESARLEERLEQQAEVDAAEAQEDRERMAQVASLTERADALVAENEFDDARTLLEEALALAPDSEVLASKQVETYVSQGDYERRSSSTRARQAYQKALELDPDNADARSGVSRIDQSRRSARQSKKRVGELTEAGLTELRREEYRDAYRSFSEVLKLEPNNARAKEFRDQAGTLLEQQVRPIYEEGVRLYNAGELSAAMERFQRVLDLHPDHADTRSFIARAIERVRSEAVDLYKRAYIYEGLGRSREALALYQESLALLPDPSEEYHQKAAERIAELNRKLQ